MVLNSFVVVFDPVLPRRFPGRKRQPSDDARTAPITPSSRWKSTANGALTCVLAARGLVVEHVDGFEMRVVVAKVLTVAINAVLVA